jgi:sulfite exporter TauE/SafE
MIALLTGIIAGIIHVLSGPDHLAAVAPFVARRRYSVWKAGFMWGLGHTWSVWLLAVVVVGLKSMIPLDPLAGMAEMLVGFTLIVIGVLTLRRALSSRIHHHEHEHDGVRHAHFHVHERAQHPHPRPHQHSHAPLGIGMLHGIAGSAHLIALLPAVALPSASLGVAYIGGYGIGTIVAMTAFAWAFGRVIGRWMNRYTRAYNLTLAITAVAALAIGVFWIVRSV